jgi:hypothetical protein
MDSMSASHSKQTGYQPSSDYGQTDKAQMGYKQAHHQSSPSSDNWQTDNSQKGYAAQATSYKQTGSKGEQGGGYRQTDKGKKTDSEKTAYQPSQKGYWQTNSKDRQTDNGYYTQTAAYQSAKTGSWQTSSKDQQSKGYGTQTAGYQSEQTGSWQTNQQTDNGYYTQMAAYQSEQTGSWQTSSKDQQTDKGYYTQSANTYNTGYQPQQTGSWQKGSDNSGRGDEGGYAVRTSHSETGLRTSTYCGSGLCSSLQSQVWHAQGESDGCFDGKKCLRFAVCHLLC